MHAFPQTRWVRRVPHRDLASRAVRTVSAGWGWGILGAAAALLLGPGLLQAQVPVPAGDSAAHAAHAAHQGHAGSTPSAYADLMDREVKALSDAEVASLLAGEGMGFALAAELNGVPGPLHLLELREEMRLSERVLLEVEAIFRRMREQTAALGGEVVALERTLDRRFLHRHIDPPTLRELTEAIALLQGEIRSVHLEAHLEVDALLTDEERARYAALRGYAPGPAPAPHPGHEGAFH